MVHSIFENFEQKLNIKIDKNNIKHYTVIEIANKIKQNGGNLYLVGGAVRDQLIGIESYDEDYCVTGISKERFKALFPNSFCRGKSFEVFDIDGKEFALARTEVKTGKGHKSFAITTNEDITIIQDLKRRDITINSIAKDVLTEEIIDPFGGQEDIKNHIIRATSEAFMEDPLRAYRAARFACKLGFDIDKYTIELMSKLRSEITMLSVERVFDEMRKAISCKRPSIFFQMLKRANILDVHFIELYNLIGALQPKEHHPEGDAYNHTMLAIDRCAEFTEDTKIRFATLVHDFGKGLTPKSEYPHHYNHDVNGVKVVLEFCNRLKIPNDWTDCGKVAAKEHMKGGIFYKMTPKKQVDFLERVYKTKLGLKGLELVVESDRNCRGIALDRIEFAHLGNRMISTINGNYIKEQYGICDGIKLKEKLHEERINWIKNYSKT